MQEHFEKVIGRLRTLEGLTERLQTVEGGGGGVKVVAVKYAEFTGTQSASVTAGNNVAITDLIINHAMAKSTNKLWLLGQVGTIADNVGVARPGVAFAKDGTLIFIADAAGTRTRTSAVGGVGSVTTATSLSHHISTIHEPNSTASIVYTLRGINVRSTTQTLYINRIQNDADGVSTWRGASSITLIELEG